MENNFIHPLSDVKSKNIGSLTKVWQFVVILEQAVIGEDCNINCNCFIENDVTLGDRVTVKSGVYLWDGLRIADDVFIGANTCFINDDFPRSKQYRDKPLMTYIEKGASIGAGSVIMGGLTLGEGCMIGAGSLVTKDIPPHTLWFGSPAKFIRDC